MTAVGCGAVEVNPPQHSIKRREKCGLGCPQQRRFGRPYQRERHLDNSRG
jgi:hypothetical protein